MAALSCRLFPDERSRVCALRCGRGVSEAMSEGSQTSRVPEIGNVIAQKYRIIRHIGAGGMGLVLEAEHTRTGKRVALKCLYGGLGADHEARQRFLLEARASARV